MSDNPDYVWRDFAYPPNSASHAGTFLELPIGPCPFCSGSLTAVCQRCAGTKEIYTKCFRCMGLNYITAGRSGATINRVDCPDCNNPSQAGPRHPGTAPMECPECDGAGVARCRACKGGVQYVEVRGVVEVVEGKGKGRMVLSHSSSDSSEGGLMMASRRRK